MKNTFKSISWVLFLTILLLGVPRLAGMVAVFFDYQFIDPHGAYAWIAVHHIVQALIFILIIIAINFFKPMDYGFHWGNKKVGWRYLAIFTLIFGTGSLVNHLIAIYFNTFQPFSYPLTAGNILGQLSFQLFLSGPSEELIFRAFAITMLALVIKSRIIKGKVSTANLIAAIIFGMAHISFSLVPFDVTFSTYQVILSIVLGIFYGDCYEKTGSVYYPMIMHSVSNVIMVGLTVIATYFFYI